ncbi:hypothetical protein [Diaphorobacter nitroreducens]|uniref:hypothetical protein n=1 Tax=Diaphorobacter nitroreducens TaxID=164759 RepID=UPI0035B4F927
MTAEIYIAPAPAPAPTTSAAPPPPAVPPPPPPPPYVQPYALPIMSAPVLSRAAQLTLMPSVLGKPGLDDVRGLPPELVKAVLAQFSSQNSDQLIRLGEKGLEISAKQKEDANKLAEKRLNDFFQALENASKKSGMANFLDKFRYIVPVLAVIAIPLTAGAAAPIAVMVAATSLYSIAQFASQEAGGPSLGIADQMATGIGKLLQDKLGLSEQDARHYGMMATGVVTVLAAVALRNGLSMGAGGGSVLQQSQQLATFAAKAAAPLMVVVDPKFAGNVAGGLHHTVAQADGADEEQAAREAAIVNVAVSAVTQLVIGLALGAQSGGDLGKLLGKTFALGAEATETATRVAQGAQLIQDGLTVANGSTSAARGGLKIETARLQHEADQAELETERSAIESEELQALHELALDIVKEGFDSRKQMLERLAETSRDDTRTTRDLQSKLRNTA